LTYPIHPRETLLTETELYREELVSPSGEYRRSGAVQLRESILLDQHRIQIWQIGHRNLIEMFRACLRSSFSKCIAKLHSKNCVGLILLIYTMKTNEYERMA